MNFQGFFNELNKGFKNAFEALNSKPKQKRRKCLHRDTTRFTQYQFDYIMWVYNQYKEHNDRVKAGLAEKRATIDDVVKIINTKMGTQKSRTAISKVWQGKVNRDELAVGEAYFTY